MHNAITGYDDPLICHLARAIGMASRIRFNVAFMMESGAKLLAPVLHEAYLRGAEIKILTGRYMSITEPSAIYYLFHKFDDKLDIRFYSDNLRSFHPKAYIFDYEADAEIFVGSSNMSQSALTCGLEWNYRLLRSQNRQDYERFSRAFDGLFDNHAEQVTHELLRKYASSWTKPSFIKHEDAGAQPRSGDADHIAPHGAQVEAMYELKRARDEGVEKGLVIAATGVGKTYLAAFDSIQYEHILFLAHREEILQQAEASFKRIRPGAMTGFYTGQVKDEGAAIYFATVQTLARERHLQRFARNYFDYIIVDEFHHAAADSYQAVIDYFKPQFLLGLTATPYRTDNRDIYAICEDNVVYELYLKDAINRDLLVPFRYYGLYDGTDYSGIKSTNGKYDINELERELSKQGRADLILEKYRRLAGPRTLAFCASVNHADYMSKFFNVHGVKSAAVHSGSSGNLYQMGRREAVEALEQGPLAVIFSVDIFNEGVDIPSIDTVMFLRPTESFVVFLQQLGRGLRKDLDKRHLTVLDFIGNYKRAHYIPALLAGDNPTHPVVPTSTRPTDIIYPENCMVQFEFEVLELFEQLAQSDPLKKRMQDDYHRLKEILKRKPTRVDIFEGSDIPIREFLKHGWLRFVQDVNDLDEEESRWIDGPAEAFLREVEKTAMTRAYKIPTIGALLTDGTILKQISLSSIGEQFMSFYKDHPLHQKDLRDQNNQAWRTWTTKEFTKLAKQNPVHFLSRSKLFNYDEINKIFYLSDDLVPYLNNELAAHVRDILEYRRLNYFRKRFKEES
jgi:superfamily II DNA or RNA helicase/HKD family nuclease